MLTGAIRRLPSTVTELLCRGNRFAHFDPDVLSDVAGLRIFDVAYNRLQGTLPRGLSNNTLLHTIDVSNNFLSGPIPEELTKLNPEKLRRLDLSKNNFSGSVPNGFERIVTINLECFNVCGNPLLNVSRLDPSTGSNLSKKLVERFKKGHTDEDVINGPICKYGCNISGGSDC